MSSKASVDLRQILDAYNQSGLAIKNCGHKLDVKKANFEAGLTFSLTDVYWGACNPIVEGLPFIKTINVSTERLRDVKTNVTLSAGSSHDFTIASGCLRGISSAKVQMPITVEGQFLPLVLDLSKKKQKIHDFVTEFKASEEIVGSGTLECRSSTRVFQECFTATARCTGNVIFGGERSSDQFPIETAAKNLKEKGKLDKPFDYDEGANDLRWNVSGSLDFLQEMVTIMKKKP